MMRRTILSAIMLATATLAANGWAPSADAARTLALAIRDPLIRPTAPGQPVTAAYLTVFNLTAKPLRLTSVACDCAASVSAHESRMSGGVMQMRPLDVVVPPRGKLAFAPGGLHLMVMGLKRSIRLGETVTMQMRFESLPPMTVKFLARR